MYWLSFRQHMQLCFEEINTGMQANASNGLSLAAYILQTERTGMTEITQACLMTM